MSYEVKKQTKTLEANMTPKEALQYIQLNPKWRLPTKEEATELFNNQVNKKDMLYCEEGSIVINEVSYSHIDRDMKFKPHVPLFKYRITLVRTELGNYQEEIERFAIDRGIDKMRPVQEDYIANVLEELLEHIGLDVPKRSRSVMMYKFNKMTEELLLHGHIDFGGNSMEASHHDRIDSIADVIVFSLTELMKYNVDISKVLFEASKEINSRVGSIVNGKFEKDLSDEAMSKWYKANYDKCKGGN